MPIIKEIAVFCGSNTGNNPLYAAAAQELANAMIHQNITLLYGGAKVGLMGIIANQMLAKGGQVIGVMPQSLVDVEIAHKGLTELHVVQSMHERKALLSEKADAFIMLPGGSGSLDEFFEIFTWAQLGYHHKPCGILNVNGYYDYLLKFLDHSVNEKFLKQVHRDMIIVESDPTILIDHFENYKAPSYTKWINEPIKEFC